MAPGSRELSAAQLPKRSSRLGSRADRGPRIDGCPAPSAPSPGPGPGGTRSDTRQLHLLQGMKQSGIQASLREKPQLCLTPVSSSSGNATSRVTAHGDANQPLASQAAPAALRASSKYRPTSPVPASPPRRSFLHLDWHRKLCPTPDSSLLFPGDFGICVTNSVKARVRPHPALQPVRQVEGAPEGPLPAATSAGTRRAKSGKPEMSAEHPRAQITESTSNIGVHLPEPASQSTDNTSPASIYNQ